MSLAAVFEFPAILLTANSPPPNSLICTTGPNIPPCGVFANGNTQTNSANNNADVSVGNH